MNESELGLQFASDFASLDTFANLDVPQLRAEFAHVPATRIDELLCAHHRPETRTALSLLADPLCQSALSTGCALIDAFLRGGVRCSLGLTEICGEAGSGKSTFAMRLALMAQLPRACGGLDGAAVYFCTEDFSDRRLRQLQTFVATRYAAELGSRTAASLGDRVFVRHVRSLDELWLSLQQLPLLMRERAVRLVVIDSIASLFRCESFTREQLFERTNFLFSFARHLRALSEDFHAAVVVTNQVSDVVNERATVLDDASAVQAALGPSWSACVTTRLALRRISGRAVAQSRAGAVVEPKRSVAVADASAADVVDASAAGAVDATRLLSVSLSPELEAGSEIAVGVDESGLFGVLHFGGRAR
jgi:RecA/RadA recombinase